MRKRKGLASGLLGITMGLTAGLNAGVPSIRAEESYPSASAAAADAYKFMQKRDYKSAQAPLEAALKLAPDDAYRLKVYNNLMACYRLLPETDKMTEACEFTIAKTKENSERSITARSLASFMFQRGKLDETRKLYEQRLSQNENDLVSLAMLTSLHQVHFDDRDKAKQYRARLDKVEQGRAAELAAEEEKQVASDERGATGHWKQAAVYWMRAGETAKSLTAAKQAEATGPEKRSEQLLHHWHVQLADVYLQADALVDAIRHLEEAIKTTTIAGYKKDCEKKLAEAKAKIKDV